MSDKKNCFVSIDVEDDFSLPSRQLSKRTWKGVENLSKILDVFEKRGISATLFTTGQVLEKYPELVKEWSKSYEIACHTYTHRFWNRLSTDEREKELENFISLYQKIFNRKPYGFRAPSHIIDEKGMKLLEQKGFLYDSSIVPRYPFFIKYRGYKKRAPLSPYHPAYENCRKKGNMKILEIPAAGLILGIPLWGTWLKYIPYKTFKNLLKSYSPKFSTLSIHSWDVVSFRKRQPKNAGKRFLKILDKTFCLLEKHGYSFYNGKKIFDSKI